MKCLLLVLLLLPFASYAQNVADPALVKDTVPYRAYFWNHLPEPSNWVNDFEGIFSSDEEADLNATVASLNASAHAQFCIVAVDTMAVSPEKFDSLVQHIANVWGVGQKGINNGITIGICKGYRRIRICNGNGIAARLSDAETKDIIDQLMTPLFKKGEYYGGMLAGLNAIATRLSGK